MPRPVFISYARGDSAAQAQTLADRLGELAFLDTEAIEDGAKFTPRLLDGVLDAGVAFCRREMRLALAGGETEASHIVMGLGEEHRDTLGAMENLALTLHEAGEGSAAVGLLRRCLAAQRRVLGDQHPDAVATAEFLKRIVEPPEAGS